jgi:hypothetical protein
VINVEEIEQTWAAATPGPWRLDDPEGDRDWIPVLPEPQNGPDFKRCWEVGIPHPHSSSGYYWTTVPTTEEDARAIAAAPEHIAALIARVRELEAALPTHDERHAIETICADVADSAPTYWETVRGWLRRFWAALPEGR